MRWLWLVMLVAVGVRAEDYCGLAKYPVSRPTAEILAEVPRGRTRSAMGVVKLAIDRNGVITHLRVVRLAYPQAANSAEINAQAVEVIKKWRYEPLAVCAEVAVGIDFR